MMTHRAQVGALRAGDLIRPFGSRLLRVLASGPIEPDPYAPRRNRRTWEVVGEVDGVESRHEYRDRFELVDLVEGDGQ